MNLWSGIFSFTEWILQLRINEGTLKIMARGRTWLRGAGNSALDLKTLEVEGTSYNPADGGVVGITTLSKNLEVLGQPNAPSMLQH